MIESKIKENAIYKIMFLTLAVIAWTVLIDGTCLTSAYAQEADSEISGEIYEFDKDKSYAFSSEMPTEAAAYGSLSVSGDISEKGIRDDIPALKVEYGNLNITYSYTDRLLNASDDEWHLVKDNGKKVDSIDLKQKIQKGALILQTSKDGEIWVDSYIDTNIFEKEPSNSKSFAVTTDVQLSNGCYYRVIVAYEVKRSVDASKLLFVPIKNSETKRYAEVYRFYASRGTESTAEQNENAKTYNLGSKVRTKKFDGYYGSKEIKNDDPHYGWELGQFFVNGFTDYIKDEDDNVVFLKNAGDQLALWFNLQQDINCLNGNEALTIMRDTAGSDQYFETPKTNFGHGALIVRKINSDNSKEEPQIYTNYLEATATVGANTKVDLFEEGDYEVALDYAVKYDKTKVLGQSILPEEAHYRIYFKFSVRNSNSMFFPRDSKTQSELSDNSSTPNGFFLDLANSQYLKLYVIKEVLKDGEDGLMEDVRYNRAAKDGDTFEDEGLYTITVTNEYTGKSTTKRIYVGNNDIIKAYMTTGLSISEIKDKLADGAAIADDGTIVEQTTGKTEKAAGSANADTSDKSDGIMPTAMSCIVIGFVLAGVILGVVIKRTRHE